MKRHWKSPRDLTKDFINSDKLVWQPTKVLTSLGIEVDLDNDTLKISSEGINSILFTIEFILSKIYVSARTLSKLTDKTYFDKTHNRKHGTVENKSTLQGNRKTIIFGQKI